MYRRLRWMVDPNKRSPTGATAVGFGLRIGYWPCLRAPYVQIAFLFWRLDVWYGLYSYKKKK